MNRTKPFGGDRLRERLAALLEVSPKTNREIAAEVGYSRPHIISMFKQGATRVPLVKIGPLAKALHADPAHLMRLALEDYMPETLEALESCLGPLLSENETEMLEIIRAATDGQNPKVQRPKDVEALKAWARGLSE